MMAQARVIPPSAHGSQREALAAMLPFLLGALISLLNLLNARHAGIPAWVGNGLGATLLGLFVIGVIRGLPRWSLPLTGLIGLQLSWIITHRGTFMGMNTRAGLLGPLLGWVDRLILAVLGRSTPWAARVVFGTGLDWFVLLGLTAIVVLIVAAVRPLRLAYSRIRDDWTRVSFGLYGATMMAVFYTFEDYPSGRYPFMVASSLILAAGAWVYMRAGRSSGQAQPFRRALPLFAAMMLAMTVGAAGKAILYASPNWPYPHSFTWRSEALQALLLWAWVKTIVLAPALLALLPPRAGRTRRDGLGSGIGVPSRRDSAVSLAAQRCRSAIKTMEGETNEQG
jgi:hypothetical protein